LTDEPIFILGLFKVRATPATNKPDGYELELLAEVVPNVEPEPVANE
jgi:hypothetical protein